MRAFNIARNAILALATGALTAGLIAGAGGTADAAIGYDQCPDGMSRRAVLLEARKVMPTPCRLSQCKAYAPAPGHVTYASKNTTCEIAPWPVQPVPCTLWMYQIAAANAPTNYCPNEVETAHWQSN